MFDLGDGWVLRRYRDHEGAEREAATIEHVRRHGFPAPAVREAAGRDIVMERIDGPSMLEEMLRRPWSVRRHARVLAELHHALHAVPALETLPAPFGEGPAILHMDLHPANVLLSSRGPVVIDWAAASRGMPEANIAQAWIIMATSVIPASSVRRWLGGAAREAFVREFLRTFEPRGSRTEHWHGAERFPDQRPPNFGRNACRVCGDSSKCVLLDGPELRPAAGSNVTSCDVLWQLGQWSSRLPLLTPPPQSPQVPAEMVPRPCWE